MGSGVPKKQEVSAMRRLVLAVVVALAPVPCSPPAWAGESPGPGRIVIGQRPLDLVRQMNDGPLKAILESCGAEGVPPSHLSIGHRGAPLLYPEHTRESYEAAARMGAGIEECDVTFTRDLELVCRHSQCDLHTTTNILSTPLATKCTEPFTPARLGADGTVQTPASARCCTSDLTLEEFRSLRGRRDISNPAARTVEEYLGPVPDAGPQLDEPDFVVPPDGGTLMTHAESIALFQSLGVDMIPELKTPAVPMPFRGLTQEAYAQKLIDEYHAAGVPAEKVWPQSFNLDDILYWIEHEPDFGRQALYLEGRPRAAGFDPADPSTWHPGMEELSAQGVRVLGPPIVLLLNKDDGKLVPSTYARRAREAGLDIITWSLERPGPDPLGRGWSYQFVGDLVEDEGDVYPVLDALVREVGVIGVFTDWPATVTYYAHCRGQGPVARPR
jgi:glycerophosphoryl diester phosphodiesterase